MEKFLFGSACTSIAWIVGLTWKDARIPHAFLRLYAVSLMTTGLSLAVMGLIPLFFGQGNEAITRDIAALTVPQWPLWLLGIGSALAALPWLLLHILRIVGAVRHETEKDSKKPSP